MTARSSTARVLSSGIQWESFSSAELSWIAVHDREAFEAMLAEKRSREDGRPFAEHLREIQARRTA